MNLDHEFSKIFERAQRHLGPAEAGWTFNVQNDGEGHPELSVDEKAKSVIVHVTSDANKLQLIYQMNHEAAHGLSPRSRRDTLFFEEGLANWFALNPMWTSKNYAKGCTDELHPLLRTPYRLFLKLNPTFAKIRELRSDPEYRGLDEVTPELIMKHFGATKELSESLMKRLPIDRPADM